MGREWRGHADWFMWGLARGFGQPLHQLYLLSYFVGGCLCMLSQYFVLLAYLVTVTTVTLTLLPQHICSLTLLSNQSMAGSLTLTTSTYADRFIYPHLYINVHRIIIVSALGLLMFDSSLIPLLSKQEINTHTRACTQTKHTKPCFYPYWSLY